MEQLSGVPWVSIAMLMTLLYCKKVTSASPKLKTRCLDISHNPDHIQLLQHLGSSSSCQSCFFSVSLQMNDYMAAYHDAVLLIGKVMRQIIEKNSSAAQQMEFVNVNYFRNTSFNGKKERRCSQKISTSVMFWSWWS